MFSNLKYLIIALMVMLFVLAYVWQNVEIMKKKIDFRNILKEEYDLVKLNDKLKYRIETFKRMEVIEAAAYRLGMREVSYNDFIAIAIKQMPDSKGKEIIRK